MEKNPKFYSVLISSNEVMKLQSLEYGVSDHGVHYGVHHGVNSPPPLNNFTPLPSPSLKGPLLIRNIMCPPFSTFSEREAPIP